MAMVTGGYQVGKMDILTKKAENQRTNKSWTLLYVRSGSGMYIYEGKLFCLNESDVLLFPPRVSYKLFITVSPFKLLFAIYCIDCLYHYFLKPSLWDIIIRCRTFCFFGGGTAYDDLILYAYYQTHKQGEKITWKKRKMKFLKALV